MKKLMIITFGFLVAFTTYQVNAVNQSVEEVVTVSSVEALANSENIGGACKWTQQKCSSGVTREVCLIDGNGSTCICGSVTRPC